MKPAIEYSVGSKWCVVMFYDDARKLLGDFTSQVNLRYCQRQGYDFRLFREKVDGRSGHWSKMAYVRECLNGHEMVFWIDADAEFTNHHVRLETFDQKGAVLIICQDAVPGFCLNSGVFILRNHPSAFAFLDWVSDPKNSVYMGDYYGEMGEQPTIVAYASRMGNEVVVFPVRAFNSQLRPLKYPNTQWQPGDFVGHAPGEHSQELKLKWLMDAAKGT